jgi:hypothetical protein
MSHDQYPPFSEGCWHVIRALINECTVGRRLRLSVNEAASFQSEDRRLYFTVIGFSSCKMTAATKNALISFNQDNFP